jgi:hypothetical protein
MGILFALGAKCLAASYTGEHTAIAFRCFTNVALAEMMPLGKVVTFAAPSLANLGHYAVCALLFGACRHTRACLSK